MRRGGAKYRTVCDMFSSALRKVARAINASAIPMVQRQRHVVAVAAAQTARPCPRECAPNEAQVLVGVARSGVCHPTLHVSSSFGRPSGPETHPPAFEHVRWARTARTENRAALEGPVVPLV